jgi:alkanesulfonate monooxygenase SsuD/methylene tetrahydromethanopterin reductase-like flavin-dependent oxidoreductase (luciferase family)
MPLAAPVTTATRFEKSCMAGPRIGRWHSLLEVRVRFGVWDHFERRAGIPLDRQFQEKIELLQEAEQLGFVGYHIAEHHLTPLDMAPSPNVFLAALAQATTRLRIGTMVYILPLYHPVRLIQEICMLDNLSAGRLDVGIGRGIRPVELEWFGLDPNEGRQRTEETLQILVETLRAGRFAHSGTYYQIPEAPLDILPMQRPYPPLWYAGGVDFAGRHHLNFLGRTARNVSQYWDLVDQHRSEPDVVNQHLESPVGAVTRHVVVRETEAEAQALARRAWATFDANFHATSTRMLEGRRVTVSEDFDAVLRDGDRLLVGTPATVREFVADAVKELRGRPNFYFAPALQWGDMTLDESRESMRLLANEVMPAFVD